MVLPVIAAVGGLAMKTVTTAAAIWTANKAVSVGVSAYKDFKKTAEEKAADRIDHRQPCSQTKEQRARARQQAVANTQAKLNDPNLPEQDRKELQAAQDRFVRNNQAVEYAKLSEHTYDQYDPTLRGADPKGPPPGWTVCKPEDVGLDPTLLNPEPPSTFRAVVYKNSFGMMPEYTVAMRGTEPRAGQNDIAVDIANAAGQETNSYEKAKKLATALQNNPTLNGNTAVTGHSLGGGLAQVSALKMKPPPAAFMFNSAGPHPEIAGYTAEENSMAAMAQKSSGFKQFRSPCDPLTAISGTYKEQSTLTKALQRVARGLQWAANRVPFVGQEKISSEAISGDLSIMRTVKQVTSVEEQIGQNKDRHGWYIPPNMGKMNEVGTKDSAGKDVPCMDPGGQHSVSNLVNGFEHEKTVDLLVMQKHGTATVNAVERT
jgi:hypothetical protein